MSKIEKKIQVILCRFRKKIWITALDTKYDDNILLKQVTQKIIEIVNENKEFYDANTELNHKLIRENDNLKRDIEELKAYHKGLLEGMSKDD